MKQKPGFEVGEPSASLRVAPGQQEAAGADDGRYNFLNDYRGIGQVADAKAAGDAADGSPDANPKARGRTATQQVMDDLDGLTAGMRAR